MADRRKVDSISLLNGQLVWTLFLFLTMLILVCLWNYLSIRDIYASSRSKNAASLSNGLGLSLSDKLISRDYAEIEAILRKSFLNKNLQVAIVSDLNGKKISHLKREEDKEELIFDSNLLSIPNQTSLDIKIEEDGDNGIRVWQPLDIGLPIGWLYLELNDKTESIVLSRLRNGVFLMLAVILIASFCILLIINRGLKRDLLKNEGFIRNERDYWNNKAFEDSLTKLPNRHSLSNIINSAIHDADTQKKLLGILFLDLDGFKAVNDQYGHLIGDLLLVQVAQRLIQLFRAEDHIIRYGGDEFVVICQYLDSRKELESLLERILEQMNIPYDLNGNIVNVLASIGVTLYPTDGISSPSELINHADESMYLAKRLGKNRVHYFL